MAEQSVKILDSIFISHDVKRFTVEKPKGFRFTPGQAVRLALDQPGWTGRKKPFTITSLPSARSLEFIIKLYPERNGLTRQLGLAKAGDHVFLGAPFGAIRYKGPGFFFAGGAGVTPFIAILRDLQKKKQLAGNTLLCSNKTADDLILDKELAGMLGKSYLNIFTRQNVIGFRERRLDRDMIITLVQDFNQYFYVCGPADFVEHVSAILRDLGAKAESIIFED